LTAALAVTGLLAVPGAAAAQGRHVPQATATGTGGAAATADSLATDAAIDALRRGGNAVDGAVAAAGVFSVTDQFSAGIGGGGFMVIRTADGEVTTIDHRETAPRAMGPRSFWEDGEPLSFNDARWSGRSAGVPGTVEGWDEALRKYGTFSLDRALRPAVRVAREGFVVDETFASQVESGLDYLNDISSTTELFLDDDGTAPDVGSVHRNPDLARTLRQIGRRGPEAFYRGKLARAIVRATRRPPLTDDADHEWRSGVMTLRDLREYRAPEREATRSSFRGFDVFGMAPPSSGGSTVGEILNIVETQELSPADRARALHLFLEASALAFADRNVYVADPAFFAVPLRGLLSDEFAATRAARLDTARAAAKPVDPGNPYPFDTVPEQPVVAAQTTQGGETTTHLSVADRHGTVVSYTFTVESVGGNGIVVPGYGFVLNNELTDFNFDSLTHPNRVEGGKRPRSSMSPTIVQRDGRAVLAVGSPGGSTIITTVAQILVDRLGLGTPLPDALAAPRASQRNTANVTAEPALVASPEGQALAAQYGHAFTETAEIGAATGVELLPDGRLLAAAEPTRRGGGNAQVVRPGG
jgi:gamma-glutamyltranspeptidase/glutathione hydrolase